MTMSLTRRSIAALVIAGGLLLAALGAAPEANAGTIYVCVKKNGTVRFVSKSAKCKKKEKKLSWNTEGLAGKNGLNGVNGVNGANGKEGPAGKEGKAGANGTARGYAVVSNSVEFEGAHPGFSGVERIGTGVYCLIPAAGSGLDQSGATIGSPGSAAAVSVDFGWSSGTGNIVQLRQRPFGSCPAADFEVYTFTLSGGAFIFSNSVGFHILVP